jgi:DNA polymerase-3 subunit delta
MPAFKPAYLIHGDDHGRIAERRARLRALAERESGAQGIEVFEGEQATPDAVASALSAMTFAIGRRFIVVDGVERWKDKDLDQLVGALKAGSDDTTVAFFAREDSRTAAPRRLHEAVSTAGGDISAEQSVKQWQLPKWVSGQAKAIGITLESGAPSALIARVGDRQQRLLRELEKLALDAGPGARLDAEAIEELAAPSAERKAWSLADALLAGDPQAATRALLALRAQGERVPGLLYWMARRLREAHALAVAIEAGQPPQQVARGLGLRPKAADQLIEGARRAGADRLREAIVELADLELASRGGGGKGGVGEDTAALLAIQRIAA